jgi:tetratricopeptide (TPR) repeat protein
MAAARVVLLAISLLLSLGAASDLPAQPQATDQLIKFFQSRVARDSADFFSYNKLGAAYLQKARETGDITYYELAEKALKKSLELLPAGPTATSATTSLAVVQLAQHRFADALTSAQKALALGSGDRSPQAVVGDAHLEMGEYEKASLAYSKMLALSGPLHPSSRLSYLQFLRGDPPGAVEHMRRAVATAIEGNAPPENVAWSRVQLGELFFQMGEVAKADAAYQEALTTYPRYHRALAGLGKVRAVQQKYQDAIELYHKALDVIPLPEYAAALGDVYTRIGRAGDAKRQYQLVEYIGYLNTVNKTIYNRELALFYADHDIMLKEALDLAQKELEVRRDIYTHDVLAWALYKNGKLAEARAAMADALRLGTRDARLFFHAGMIHRGLGDTEKAREYLRRALSTNPHFHVLQAEVAERTLKELGVGGGR